MGLVAVKGFELRRCKADDPFFKHAQHALCYAELWYDGKMALRLLLPYARKLVRVFANGFPVWGVDVSGHIARDANDETTAYLVRGAGTRRLMKLPYSECFAVWSFIHRVTGQGKTYTS